MIQLVVLDLDNTTLTADKRITERTVQTVRNLANRGVLFSVATGRAFELTLPYANTLGVTIPFITNNGALIKDKDGTIHHRRTLTTTAKRDMLSHARKHGLGFTTYTEDGFYTNDTERIHVYREWNKAHPESPVRIHEHENTATLIGIEAYKLLMLDDDCERFMRSYRQHEQRHDAVVIRSQDAFLDVLPPATSKASALNVLLKQLDIDPQHVLAFGDNDNDAAMLEYVGRGVAMPNGSDRAKTAADDIAEADNESDGVARTLETLMNTGVFGR